MNYIWGIDLAESLNFCGIIIGSIINNKIRVNAIRKFNNVMYPNIQDLIWNELLPQFPSTTIGIDYTYEKGLAQWLEGKLNPSFLSIGTPYYHKWRYVNPVTFSVATKQEMKNNSRQLHESKLVEYPNPTQCTPEQQELLKELQEQLLREGATDSPYGLRFPKPEGYDNDLAIAMEIMLYAARPHLKEYGTPQSDGPAGIGVSDEMMYDDYTPESKTESTIKSKLEKMGITPDNIKIGYPK